MNIVSNSLHLIDVGSGSINAIQIATDNEDLKKYLKELLEKITSSSSKRKFSFERDTTEVKSSLDRIISGEDFSPCAEINARRLLQKEKTAQEEYEQLRYEIQKGVLVQSLVEVDGVMKIIIAKADHTDYLDGEQFRNRKGFPIRKKIYKAFLAEYNSSNAITEIFVYDTNASIAKYWWSDFLELTEINTDEHNTDRAFEAVDKMIFAKMKSDFPADHNILRNRVLGYFRSSSVFEMDSFIENAFRDYTPVNEDLNVPDMVRKIRELPEKKGFDSHFNIRPEVIKAKKLRSIVPITDKIDLHIKDHIDDLNHIIESYKYQGEKYIRIKTDTGYEAFKQ